jgi:hypothetical protein
VKPHSDSACTFENVRGVCKREKKFFEQETNIKGTIPLSEKREKKRLMESVLDEMGG